VAFVLGFFSGSVVGFLCTFFFFWVFGGVSFARCLVGFLCILCGTLRCSLVYLGALLRFFDIYIDL
jgi:hypothetical protein